MNSMSLYYKALKVEDRNHLTILISNRNSQSALFKGLFVKNGLGL